MTSCSLLVMDSTRSTLLLNSESGSNLFISGRISACDTYLSKEPKRFSLPRLGGGRCKLQSVHWCSECKLTSLLTTEISSKLVITGPFGLTFSAVLPETQTFRKCYRVQRRWRMQYTKVHPRIFVTYTCNCALYNGRP